MYGKSLEIFHSYLYDSRYFKNIDSGSWLTDHESALILAGNRQHAVLNPEMILVLPLEGRNDE